MRFIYDKNGMAGLIIVVIIGVMAFLMAYSASLLGLGNLEMSYDYQRGSESLAMADGCMEEAIYRLKLDNDYIGGVLEMEGGSCIITISLPGGGVDRRADVLAIYGNYQKKVQTDLDIDGENIIILAWRDIAL